MQPRLRRRAARVPPETRGAVLVPGADYRAADAGWVAEGRQPDSAQGMRDDEETRRRERSRADRDSYVKPYLCHASY
jgi:hypothetical protein